MDVAFYMKILLTKSYLYKNDVILIISVKESYKSNLFFRIYTKKYATIWL